MVTTGTDPRTPAIEISTLGEDIATRMRRGESLLFTDGGRPVGFYDPSVLPEGGREEGSSEPSPEEYAARRERAIREGRLIPAKETWDPEAFFALPEVQGRGKSLLEHVLEAREEEYREER